jgi:hypothetical protein
VKAANVQTNFKPAPAGGHPAVLFGLVDLGTQEGEWQGKTTHQRKVRLIFELHSDDTKMDDGRPMMIGRTFTLSSNENAALRQFIEGWRGKTFTDDEASEFDYRTMLGKPCILNVTHTERNGKTYANIDGAMRVPKGMAVPAQENPNVYFYMGTEDSGFSEYDPTIYEALADWLKEKVAASPEYQKATGTFLDNAAKPEPAQGADKPFDDEIPF